MADFKIQERVESTGVVVNKVGSAPSAVQDKSVVYNQDPSAGGTGIYFKTANSSSTTSDELVSKRKAITFGLVF